MEQTVKRVVAIVLLALFLTAPVAAKPATLEQCQGIKDRIERYTGLRRKGGSAGQMQQWKEQLRANEDQFRRMDCKDHRRKLQ
jgi:outer membrane lipoprotein-sorting protein